MGSWGLGEYGERMGKGLQELLVNKDGRFKHGWLYFFYSLCRLYIVIVSISDTSAS